MADTEEQTQLKVLLGELFNEACHYQGYGAHNFTETERAAFLDVLVKFVEEHQIPVIDPTWLTRQLLRTEGKFLSTQDSALAIIGSKAQ